ncbi:MAG: hypothetical protein OXC61_02900 [Flavobacteriaceae bacterium]|nr:hypothetical protein [Flavobacteriaceae bacterium]
MISEQYGKMRLEILPLGWLKKRILNYHLEEFGEDARGIEEVITEDNSQGDF